MKCLAFLAADGAVSHFQMTNVVFLLSLSRAGDIPPELSPIDKALNPVA